MIDGEIYNIDFKGYIGFEINDTHLGVIYTISNIKNMVLCVPLTSPKEKHFRSYDNFIKRNYLKLSHSNYVFIKQTDSIALLDQIKFISVNRVLNPMLLNKKNVILNNKEQILLKEKNYKIFTFSFIFLLFNKI